MAVVLYSGMQRKSTVGALCEWRGLTVTNINHCHKCVVDLVLVLDKNEKDGKIVPGGDYVV